MNTTGLSLVARRRTMRPAQRSTQDLILCLLVAGVVLFQAGTLRDGFDWFGDAPAYLQHAVNLAEGRPYAETGYVPNPRLFLAPAAYPPGYPLAMAPLIALFGVDLDVLRLANVVFFALALLVAAYAFRDDLSFFQRGVLVLAVGLQPFLWSLLQGLAPDLLFLLAIYLSLTAFERAGQARAGARSLGWAVAAGAFAYGALLTRTIGIVVLPCFLLADLLRRRTLSRALFVAVGTWMVLYGADALITALLAPAPERVGDVSSGYGNLVRHNVLDRLDEVLVGLPFMLARYARLVANLWGNGYSYTLKHAVFLLATVPVVVGFVHRLVRRVTVFDVFAVVYLAALLPWTFAHLRYFIPLIPLYYVYLLHGTAVLWHGTRAEARLPRAAAPILATVALSVLFGTYAAKYSTLDFDAIPPVFTSAEATAFYRYVEEHTPPEAVLVSGFPRHLAFFTGRSATLPHRADAHLFPYLQSRQVTHLVVGPPDEVLPWQNTHFSPNRLPELHPDRFRPVYANDLFGLYRIVYPDEPIPQEGPQE